ncbi:MAG: YqhA family protein [Desulfovibrio sp.]|nr:YqhA family protein [Desulfovibrio sp.]
MFNSVDNYLFAVVLLIFSIGIYELFISEIYPASRREDTRQDWLKIRNLDQLKGSLGKVILMIPIVTFLRNPCTWNSTARLTCCTWESESLRWPKLYS